MQKALENVSPYTNIVHQAAYYFGIGLANIAQIFDPEAIVLGGGVSESVISGSSSLNLIMLNINSGRSPFLS